MSTGLSPVPEEADPGLGARGGDSRPREDVDSRRLTHKDTSLGVPTVADISLGLVKNNVAIRRGGPGVEVSTRCRECDGTYMGSQAFMSTFHLLLSRFGVYT